MRLLVGLVAASSLLTTRTLALGNLFLYHTKTNAVELRDAVLIRAQQAGCQFGKGAKFPGLTGWLVVVVDCPRLPADTPYVDKVII
ncbi:hypothetical protein BDV23DRAFT_164910, partial [Aspergillus alliaceus]